MIDIIKELILHLLLKLAELSNDIELNKSLTASAMVLASASWIVSVKSSSKI